MEPPEQAQLGAFNAAIFRRGSKVEAFGLDPDAEIDASVELQYKLQNLHEAWGAIRTGRELVGAIWRPHLRAAEVTNVKGKLLSHMGFTQGSKLYLFIEEALYLLDRANLLLFLDLGGKSTGNNNKRLLSVKEATELMIHSGVSMDHYIIYSRLVRSGYIVQRHPAKWIIKPTDNAADIWKAWDPPSSADNVGNGTCTASTHKQPEAQGEDIQTTTSDNGGWFPPSSSWCSKEQQQLPINQDQLPRCQVDPGEFPNLYTLPVLKQVPPIDPTIMDTSRIRHHWKKRSRPSSLDIGYYKPNSAFSRRLAGDPDCILSIHTDSMPAAIYGACAAENEADGVKVRSSTVEKGDVAIYGLEHVKTKSILH